MLPAKADDVDNAGVSVGIDLRFVAESLEFFEPVADSCAVAQRISGTHGVGGRLLLSTTSRFGLDALQRTIQVGVHEHRTDAGVLQVQRVGMALRAVTDDGDLHPADDRNVAVLVVIGLHCMSPVVRFWGSWPRVGKH